MGSIDGGTWNEAEEASTAVLLRVGEDNGFAKNKSNQGQFDEEDSGDEPSVHCPPEYRYPSWICLQIRHCK